MAWDPGRYGKYGVERSRPFLDLLGFVEPRPGMRIVDLGCGTGELTRLLHDRLAARETLGIDRSAEMLRPSVSFSGPGLRFANRTIESFAAAPGGPWDLVFSNAALHWVPDHRPLFKALAAALASGGQFAVQMPLGHDDEAHRVARDVARDPEFAARLDGFEAYPRPLEPAEYEALLRALRFPRVRVEVRDYVSVLPSRDAVLDWYRGSLLTAYEAQLGPEFSTFLRRVRAKLAARLPDEKPFSFRLPRVLMWAGR